ncbi:MAG: SDR family NAD(P)-dependent oxidoreductase [Geminicoccaceae bacterium]
MIELAGQVAIVTGATSGIGTAMARALDARGVKLMPTGRAPIASRRSWPSWARRARSPATSPTRTCPGRWSRRRFPRTAHGRLDIACNNAGLLAFGTIEDIDLERMATMVRVNVEAAYRFAYIVLRHFKAAEPRAFVNTSSVAGTKVRPTIGAYAGTKHALEALAHGLRIELATTDVRISNVQPGLVATDIFAHMPADEHPGRQQGIDQPLRPEDVARAVVFMLEQPAHVSIRPDAQAPTSRCEPTAGASRRPGKRQTHHEPTAP